MRGNIAHTTDLHPSNAKGDGFLPLIVQVCSLLQLVFVVLLIDDFMTRPFFPHRRKLKITPMNNMGKVCALQCRRLIQYVHAKGQYR